MPHLRLRADLPHEERQRLILKHLPQVRLIASRIHARLPVSVNLDDLVSAGIVGLILAIDRFDPSRRVELGTYANYKIRGEILDSLRRLDWAPRLQRKHAKQIEAAIAAAKQRWQRLPTDEEVAAQLGISIEIYYRWQSDAEGLDLESLTVGPDNAGSCERRALSRDQKDCPAAVLERNELRRALAAAISELPEVHKTVLTLYYRDELSMREISKIIGRHESRVSQITRDALALLRTCMHKLWPGRDAASAGPRPRRQISARRVRV